MFRRDTAQAETTVAAHSPWAEWMKPYCWNLML